MKRKQKQKARPRFSHGFRATLKKRIGHSATLDEQAWAFRRYIHSLGVEVLQVFEASARGPQPGTYTHYGT